MRGTGWTLVSLATGLVIMAQWGSSESFNGRLSTLTANSSRGLTNNRSLKQTSQLFNNKKTASAPTTSGTSRGSSGSKVNLKTVDGETVWIDVFSKGVVFTPDSNGQCYSTESVLAEVSANYSTWELLVVLTDASGPESTLIPADAFQVAILKGTVGGGTPVPHPALVAVGTDIQPGSYSPYSLTYFCYPDSGIPAGTYTGEIRFLIQSTEDPSEPPKLGASVPYTLTKTASDPICSLDLGNDAINDSIGPYPDTYPIADHADLLVNASLAGWGLTVSCSDLLPTDSSIHDTIRAEEICLVSDGGNLSLDTIRSLVLSGPLGETPLSLQLCAVTTSQHKLGTYQGNLILSCQASPTQAAHEYLVPVELKVQITSTLTLLDPMVYFHFGKPGSSQTAQISGSLKANSPMSITLTSDTGTPQEMPQVKPFGTAKATDVSIPMEWKLGEAGASSRLPDEVNPAGNALTWAIDGLPGEVPIQFDLTVSPAEFQAPGDYSMQLRVDLTPML